MCLEAAFVWLTDRYYIHSEVLPTTSTKDGFSKSVWSQRISLSWLLKLIMLTPFHFAPFCSLLPAMLDRSHDVTVFCVYPAECPGGLLDIVLLLDSSGSMVRPPTAGVSTTDMLYNWTMIQNVSLQLANAFLPVNQSSVQIAVTPFADNPRLEIPLGHPGNERSQTAFINALRTLRYK